MSPYSKFGIKGVGEGGAIAPPAAIINAINDALAPLNATLRDAPISPTRILAAIAAARTVTRATAVPQAGEKVDA